MLKAPFGSLYEIRYVDNGVKRTSEVASFIDEHSFNKVLFQEVFPVSVVTLQNGTKFITTDSILTHTLDAIRVTTISGRVLNVNRSAVLFEDESFKIQRMRLASSVSHIKEATADFLLPLDAPTTVNSSNND